MKLPNFMCPVWEPKVRLPTWREKFLLNCALEDNSLTLPLSAGRVWISAHRIKPSALSSKGNRSQRNQLPGTVLLV